LLDQDEDALANALKDERFTLINENFRFIKRFFLFEKLDGFWRIWEFPLINLMLQRGFLLD
jgi:hypothetical protein